MHWLHDMKGRAITVAPIPLLMQEAHAAAERELGAARAALAQAQAECMTRSQALAEQEARVVKGNAALDGAKAAWVAGEEERRRAVALLQDAREEVARVKARRSVHIAIAQGLPVACRGNESPF